MVSVEVNFVVPDCEQAMAFYEKVFEVQRIGLTSFAKGMNEGLFTMYGGNFHMLDENPDYSLNAPKPGDPKSMWINVVVPDIQAVFNQAVAAGSTAILPVTENEALGMSNAMFSDPFGHVWMVHQIHREVGFKERVRIVAESMGLE